MKLEDLILMVGDQPFFDLSTVVQLSGDRRGTVKTQLYRWAKAEKIVSLRRGLYTLADPFRKRSLNTAELANALYRPSYLSLEWALGYYSLIPEKVVTFTSVTARVPRRFNNLFGVFQYSNVKRSSFWGSRTVEILGRKVQVAEPEKALIDLWHLRMGEWSVARMMEMRFQNTDIIDAAKLEEYASRIARPRLRHAVESWVSVADDIDGGEVTI